jgi:mono/diheme cytochrome c family protein
MKSLASGFLVTAGLMAIAAVASWPAADAAAQSSPATFSGVGLYEQYCATCHGPRAAGDGPLASVLRKTPTNLTLIAKNNNGVFSVDDVARIIDGRKPIDGHGGGDMPVWGDAFDRSADGKDATAAKIAAIVGYLRSVQVKSAN